MKIIVNDLGPLKKAEFELGDLTIICGNNNTGKTYATYALFGFLSMWERVLSIRVPDKKIQELLTDGVAEIDIQGFVDDAQNILNAACETYSSNLPNVFASSHKKFQNSFFKVLLNENEIEPVSSYEKTFSAPKTELFTISKQKDETNITISLLLEKEKVRYPREILNQTIGNVIRDIIFGEFFPKPFIASAERTGAAIFRKELNFARNKLLEAMGKAEKDIDPLELLLEEYSDYALPVKTNVEFTRHLEEISKKESFICTTYPSILEDFSDIIGGKYTVTKNDELYYIPKSQKSLQLTMDESSSAVRSLLDIGFYLRHEAQKGDLLIIDEPELNLHPENQRRLAKLFSRLINIGIKVFLTTHSDYIIKELNTLIMLSQDKPHLKQICEEEGYKTEELITADKIKVYIAEKNLVLLDGRKRKTKTQTLVSAIIDPYFGIEARSFDITIDEMNRIQDRILWEED